MPVGCLAAVAFTLGVALGMPNLQLRLATFDKKLVQASKQGGGAAERGCFTINKPVACCGHICVRFS